MKHYPIIGQIILRYNDDNNIFAIGDFEIKWDDETIYMTGDIDNIYPKLHADNKIIFKSTDLSCIYKYELVARKQLTTGDVETNNIFIDGIAAINGNITFSIDPFDNKVRAELNPLFDEEGRLFNVGIW